MAASGWLSSSARFASNSCAGASCGSTANALFAQLTALLSKPSALTRARPSMACASFGSRCNASLNSPDASHVVETLVQAAHPSACDTALRHPPGRRPRETRYWPYRNPPAPGALGAQIRRGGAGQSRETFLRRRSCPCWRCSRHWRTAGAGLAARALRATLKCRAPARGQARAPAWRAHHVTCPAPAALWPRPPASGSTKRGIPPGTSRRAGT